jgi:ficolin
MLNSGDSMSYHNGQRFSTFDRDNDASSKSCAQKFKGAWWYNSCHSSNLNGLYRNGAHKANFADGVNWSTWLGFYYSIQFTEMKVRPKALIN